MKIEILDSAQADLRAGYVFYEGQRAGLGDYFLDLLFSDIDSLIVYAGIHPLVFEHYHRLLSKRFPFAVYYRMEKDVARVYAVLDCRRNPLRAEDRLKNQPQ